VWRGALEAAALREFLADVAWGALDELFVDLPPGVQRFQELTELLPAPPAVLAVTIPTPESRNAVRRHCAAPSTGRRRARVVENMVGGPFAGSAADELAAEFGSRCWREIPWHPERRDLDRARVIIGSPREYPHTEACAPYSTALKGSV